jgi:chromosome segregation ATPase
MSDDREIGEFRTSVFGGFDRRDVIEYIKFSSAEHNQCLEENRQLTKKLEESGEKLEAAQARVEQTEQELKDLWEKLSGLEKENKRLTSELEAAKKPTKPAAGPVIKTTKSVRHPFWKR